MALTPPKIEQHFGITRGHIHHVDNQFGFADRLPYATPIAGLYAAGVVTGVWYREYAGALSTLRSVVFGRIAGGEAAATIRS